MEQNTKKCPYCGEEIMADAKKCRFCGEWLDKNSSSSFADNSKSKKNWIYIVLVAVVAIVITIIMATTKFSTSENTSMSDTSGEKTIATTEVAEIPIDRQIADHLIVVMKEKGYDIQDDLTFTEISQMLYFDNQVQTAIKDGWAFCKRNQHEIDSLKSNIHGTGPVKIADVQEFLAAEKRWNAKIALLENEIADITQTIDSFVPDK